MRSVAQRSWLFTGREKRLSPPARRRSEYIILGSTKTSLKQKHAASSKNKTKKRERKTWSSLHTSSTVWLWVWIQTTWSFASSTAIHFQRRNLVYRFSPMSKDMHIRIINQKIQHRTSFLLNVNISTHCKMSWICLSLHARTSF